MTHIASTDSILFVAQKPYNNLKAFMYDVFQIYKQKQ